MIPSVKKVIRAGAGTGKTYRLSLEYIGLLLQFHPAGLHFSEILVITFTKKATAEIRERIFAQLHDIIAQNESGLLLQKNLEQFFGLSVSENDRRALGDIYADMLTNKQQVQISTIDSFTHTIFKTIIAPYLGITDFSVKTKIDEPVLDELYRSILEDADKLAAFRSFFERSELKKINDYEAFVQSVIRNRWVYHLIKSTEGRRPFDAAAIELDTLLSEVQNKVGQFVSELQRCVLQDYSDKKPSDVLIKDYFNILKEIDNNLQLGNIAAAFKSLYSDPALLARHSSLLLDEKKNVWNRGRVFKGVKHDATREHLFELQQLARQAVADYLFAAFLLPEEKELFEIIEFIIERYDELKFRDKVFTHDDISFLTFKYLYDPELSLIDRDFIANAFYEHLSSMVRFVLIDEFQDTSILQYKILLPIIREVISGAGVKEYGGAIVVGDEKQSIYGWRGGERDLLLKMPRVMHGGEAVTLDTSFRSDENIIAFVNDLFSHHSLHDALRARNIEWAYTPIRSAKQNGLGYVDFYLRNFGSGKESSNDISTEEEAVRQFLKGTLDRLRQGHMTIRNTAILARRNKELDIIARALDEMGVRYMQESSRSILDHQAVKPVYLLLTFLAWGDFYDLLRFLRSDVVLLNADELKELLLAYRDAPEKWRVRDILEPCRHIAAVHKLLLFLDGIENEQDVFRIAQRIFEEYNIPGRFDSESDAKNIDHFLMLISDLHNNREVPATLRGFFDYCEQEKESDLFNQVGLDEVNALSLMTIHKSKGLEFDNVFLYWNLSSGQWRGRREMKAYLDYEEDYSGITNYLLAFNYDDIIKSSSQSRFVEEVRRREAIEELNTFYVALTRAKSNLFLGFTYRKSGGFARFLKEAGDDASMALLFVDHLRRLLVERKVLEIYNLNRETAGVGEIVVPAAEPAVASAVGRDLGSYLNSDRSAALVADEERLRFEEHVDFKSVFLKSRAVDVGTIAHYYLSFIKRGSEEEKRLAKLRTTAFWGSLLSADLLRHLFEDLDRFIDSEPELFSPRWTRVFTEHILFTPDGKEIRIDRFMVDDQKKEIQIIDYKTGHVFEKEQIETYINTLRSLPVVAREGYAVSGSFRQITLQKALQEEE